MEAIPTAWSVCGTDLVTLNGRDAVIALFRGRWETNCGAAVIDGVIVPVCAVTTSTIVGAIILYSVGQVLALAAEYRFEEPLAPFLELLAVEGFPECSDEEPEAMSAARFDRYRGWRESLAAAS